MFQRLIISLLTVALFCSSLTTAQAAVSGGDQLIQNVSLTFCHDEPSKRLHLNTIQPNEATEICMSLTNNNDVALPIALNFVDGVIASDGQNVACRDETDEKRNFAQFVTPATSNITLAPDQTIERRAMVTFPESFSGMSYGCVTYFVADQAVESGSLNVLLRKANVITAKVGGKLEVGLQALQKSGDALKDLLPQADGTTVIAESEDGVLLVKRDDASGEVFTEIALASTGNVKLDVILDSTLTGSGVEQASVRQIALLPEEQKVIRSEPLVLPWLGGGFEVKAAVSYRPVLEFETEDVTAEMLEPVEQRYAVNFFVFPWNMVVMVLGLIVVLAGILFLHHRKKQRREHNRTSYVVRSGDTIESVADQFACGWREIVKLNGLKAPYSLEVGRKIWVVGQSSGSGGLRHT